ncbi:protein ALP1-like [Rhagoletis pomonella]|uniref:protein ALP1-like n=1 Tax=Rhagoletis pomonella TaxID=28610 RepID=UPI0017821BCD|nr:protein ALP1-like [Rhagoletis pomonella]
MATCDAKFTFTSASIGSYGGQTDGAYSIFQQSAFGCALLENRLPLPPKAPLWNGDTDNLPHFFVGDAAFPLKESLMRPYTGTQLSRSNEVFNYRLSRARRVIENSFGILNARWRVLRQVIDCNPENCEKIMLACLVLHNFVMLNDHKLWYCPDQYVDAYSTEHGTVNGEWRNELESIGGPLPSTTSSRRNATSAVFRIRDRLTDFFLNQGAVTL